MVTGYYIPSNRFQRTGTSNITYAAMQHDLGQLYAREIAIRLSGECGVDRKALEADARRYGPSYVAAVEQARKKQSWVIPRGIRGKQEYWQARQQEFQKRAQGWL